MAAVFLIVLLVLAVGCVAYGASNPPERKRFLEHAVRLRRRLVDAAPLRDADIAACWTLLRQRTRWAPLTPALVGLNVVVYALMVSSADAINSSDTLIAWGGSFGPRTTNGEWWRLATTLFVHVSALHLFVDVAGLLAVGLVLERLVGPLPFAVVYAASGLSSTALGLEASPTGVTVGASGAIFGLYGLMLTVAARSVLHRSMVKIPFAVARYVAPAAMLFALYSLATIWVASGPELSALVIGCLSGLLVGRGIGEQRAPAMLSVPIAAGALAMVVVTVQPLNGMTDVRPEMLRLVAEEHEMAARYQRATKQFLGGHITADALAAVIDREILPRMKVQRVRVAALQHVPVEQQPLLTAANKYLDQRDESWRARAKGLSIGSERLLKQAERSEIAANETLRELGAETY